MLSVISAVRILEHDKIGSTGGEAIFLHQDVSLEESGPGIIDATERRFERLSVMVANAGIGIS